jgi:hypothetical protein
LFHKGRIGRFVPVVYAPAPHTSVLLHTSARGVFSPPGPCCADGLRPTVFMTGIVIGPQGCRNVSPRCTV